MYSVTKKSILLFYLNSYFPSVHSLKCFEENAKQAKRITSCPHFSLKDPAVCFTQRHKIFSFKERGEDDEKESEISPLSTDNIDGIDNDELDNKDNTIVKWQHKEKKDNGDVWRYQTRGCSSLLILGTL